MYLHDNYYAAYGNDGDYNNMAHSGQEVAPYWLVSLEERCRVFALVFYNRISNKGMFCLAQSLMLVLLCI